MIWQILHILDGYTVVQCKFRYQMVATMSIVISTLSSREWWSCTFRSILGYRSEQFSSLFLIEKGCVLHSCKKSSVPKLLTNISCKLRWTCGAKTLDLSLCYHETEIIYLTNVSCQLRCHHITWWTTFFYHAMDTMCTNYKQRRQELLNFLRVICLYTLQTKHDFKIHVIDAQWW